MSVAGTRPTDDPGTGCFTSSSLLMAYAEAIAAGHPECDHPRGHAVYVLESLWDHGYVIVSSADYLRSRPVVGWVLALIATAFGFTAGTVVAAI